MFQPGETIINGKYRLVQQLGSGSFGEVWLAVELASNLQVALKMGQVTQPGVLERAQREMRISRQLDHPNLLRASTIEQEGAYLYLVFPYAEGGSLRQKLDRRAPLPVHEVVATAIAVAEGLAYLHKHDLVHRDVHPGNILYTRDGVVKLADFGLVQSREYSDDMWHGRRMGGRHPGNEFYQPPEAWADINRPLRPLLPSADVYMLGAVIWEMLTGRAYCYQRGKRPSNLRPNVPAWLDELTMRCLQENAAARPQDGAALVTLLRQIPASSPVQAEPGAPMAPAGLQRLSRSATALIVAGAWLLCLTLLVVLYGLGRLGPLLSGLGTWFNQATSGLQAWWHTNPAARVSLYLFGVLLYLIAMIGSLRTWRRSERANRKRVGAVIFLTLLLGAIYACVSQTLALYQTLNTNLGEPLSVAVLLVGAVLGSLVLVLSIHLFGDVLG